jgi:NADPH:quinone reductase-like Zn-dependent oxidoreductase
MNAQSEVHTTAYDRTLETVESTMRAILHSRYGTPDVLALGQVERPVAGDADVLVRVHAAGASVGDHHIVTGKPYLVRLSPFGGLPRPRNRVPGTAFAGRVEAIGANVTTCKPGDEVYGEAPWGAFAEYVVVPAKRVAPKPSNLSFEEAAAVPWSVTALQGLRDAGSLEPGQRVLINGASGGVGTWGVQIAKALGAHVTAVCSTRNTERARALGADEVIDYTKRNFVSGGARFDLMFDLVGNRSLSECRSVLLPKGTYVACSGGGGDWFGPLFRLARVFFSSLVTTQKLKSLLVAPNREDLLVMKALIEAEKAKPIIERRYALGDVGEALRHVGEGRSQGQTVICIAS